jgi:hypothetical protein
LKRFFKILAFLYSNSLRKLTMRKLSFVNQQLIASCCIIKIYTPLWDAFVRLASRYEHRVVLFWIWYVMTNYFEAASTILSGATNSIQIPNSKIIGHLKLESKIKLKISYHICRKRSMTAWWPKLQNLSPFRQRTGIGGKNIGIAFWTKFLLAIRKTSA